MKAKELRLGNYIIDDVGRIVEVTHLTLTCIEAKPVNDSGIKWTTVFRAQGIPLTEQWLLKFGFENQDENRFWLDPIFLFHYVDGAKYIANQRHVNLFFVHELQNLFYAITGQDLIYEEKS